MAYEQNLQCVTLLATSAVTQYQVVSLDTAGTVVPTPLAGTSVLIAGIAQNAAAAGEPVTVAYAGVSKVLTGAAIATPGLELCVGTANGAVIARAGATTKQVVGLSLEAAGSAKWGTILINIGRSIAAT